MPTKLISASEKNYFKLKLNHLISQNFTTHFAGDKSFLRFNRKITPEDDSDQKSSSANMRWEINKSEEVVLQSHAVEFKLFKFWLCFAVYTYVSSSFG